MTDYGFSDGLASFMQWQNQYFNNMQSQTSNPWNDHGAAANRLNQGLQNQIGMMMQMGKGFMDSMESVFTATQQNGEQWQSAVSKALNEMQANFSSLQSSAFTPMMNFSGLGNEPWAAWKKLFSPAAVNPSMNPWTGMMPMSGCFGQPGLSGNWPSMPGLGPDREKFENLQRLQARGVDYLTAMFKFNEQYHDFWPHIIERLQSRIQKTVLSGDDSAASAKALYKLWIDAAEEEYAAVSGQESYHQAYGEMINAMMKFRQASTVLQDDILKAMNIPTMSELDSLSERLQRTRRENRALRTELEALRTEMAAVRQAVATGQRSAVTPARKTTRRKKTTPARSRTQAAAAPKAATKSK